MSNSRFLLRMSFVLALAATLGSLYFSEILKYPPCVLCWYQRICLYPLVTVFFSALWSDDGGYVRYSLPLAFIGLGFAAYHNLLYYGVITTPIIPCQEGVSCTSKQIELFGFVTIPLMSFMTFATICLFGLLEGKNLRKKL